MNANEAAALTKGERVKMSHGPRKHYKGKMGKIEKHGSKWSCTPRSHTHGGGNPATGGWTQGDQAAFKHGLETRNARLGPYRRIMPRNRTRFGGAFEKVAA